MYLFYYNEWKIAMKIKKHEVVANCDRLVKLIFSQAKYKIIKELLDFARLHYSLRSQFVISKNSISPHPLFHFFQPVQRIIKSIVLFGKVKTYQAVHLLPEKTGTGNRAHADSFS